MNSRLRKLLLPLLRAVKDGRPISFSMRSAASQGLFLIGRGTSKQKGPSARLKRSTEKRKSHAEETAKIREAVQARAKRCCEAFGFHVDESWRHGGLFEMDHWEQGAGRRRERQSIETCWMLCRICHESRTSNWPSAAYWNTVFGRHCAAHGYSFTPHVVHEPIARKAQ